VNKPPFTLGSVRTFVKKRLRVRDGEQIRWVENLATKWRGLRQPLSLLRDRRKNAGSQNLAFCRRLAPNPTWLET
jgi:hypothetical protein